jgi:hypothetical protein
MPLEERAMEKCSPAATEVILGGSWGTFWNVKVSLQFPRPSWP